MYCIVSILLFPVDKFLPTHRVHSLAPVEA